MTVNTNEMRQLNNRNKSMLKRSRFKGLLIMLLVAIVIGGSTFAWYIYNTKSHTTNVHMAAGTSTKLEISKAYDGPYAATVELDAFEGVLDPVSTDSMVGGFQKVSEFEGEREVGEAIASGFMKAKSSDYFKTSLYVRTNAVRQGVYICSMNYDDDDEAKLLATAIRVGIVAYEPGSSTKVASESIFELSKGKNPNGKYNTKNGYEGCVLDSSKNDGSVVDIRSRLLSPDNFVNYDSSTGLVTLKSTSKELFEVRGSANYKPGTPVKVDVYLWLEGCDEDCAGSMGSMVLKDFALSFASYDK